MRIIARNADMVPINEIDMYTSMIWTDRYESSGDFELRVPCTDNNYKLFKEARYITIDQSEEVMVIEKREIKTEVDNADEYIIKGRSADTLLDRRVIMGSITFGTSPYDEQTNETASQNYAVGNYLVWYGSLCRAIKAIVSGANFILYDANKHNEATANIVKVAHDEEAKLSEPIETIVKTMLNVTVINPTDPTRKFSNPSWRYVASTDPKVQEIKMAASFANTNLYDAMSSLLTGAGLGCKVIYNDETETFDFHIYKGVDRSVSQSENLVVNFKRVLDNLVTTDFVTDETGLKTCAYVVGAIDDKKTRSIAVADEYGKISTYEYENPNYCTTWCQQVSLSGTGMSYNRREVIVDAADIDRYQTVSAANGSTSNDVPVSEVDYRALLRTRGRTKLMESVSTHDMDAEILPDMFYKFRKDYFLGDVISIEDVFGNSVNANVTEMIFSKDVNGEKAYPRIETIGEVDGIDELVSIFVNNPIYVNAEHQMIIPDLEPKLQELREKSYIAYYVKDIIDYYLNGHLPDVAAEASDRYKIVIPILDDMDYEVFGADIASIYANPSAYPEANTRAIQFVDFMKTHQMYISADDIVIPSMDDLPSSIQ